MIRDLQIANLLLPLCNKTVQCDAAPVVVILLKIIANRQGTRQKGRVVVIEIFPVFLWISCEFPLYLQPKTSLKLCFGNPEHKSEARLPLTKPMCFRNGAVAQSVEQRTENPCVGGSIPPHTTD